jgi:ribonuclease BN (tRNA processing enzyme)
MGREDMTGMIANLHVKPSVLGRLASDANVKKVVVSHIAYPDVLDENLRYLTAKYTGDVLIASDMMCIRVD